MKSVAGSRSKVNDRSIRVSLMPIAFRDLVTEIAEYHSEFESIDESGKRDPTSQSVLKFRAIPFSLDQVIEEVHMYHMEVSNERIVKGDLVSSCMMYGRKAAIEAPQCQDFIATVQAGGSASPDGIGYYDRTILHKCIKDSKFRVKDYEGTGFTSLAFRCHSEAWKKIGETAKALRVESTVLAIPCIMYGIADLPRFNEDEESKDYLLGEWESFLSTFSMRADNLKKQVKGYASR